MTSNALDLRVESARDALSQALDRVCRQRQADIENNVPMGSRKQCEHPSCAPLWQTYIRLNRAHAMHRHVPGMLRALDERLSIGKQALEHFEQRPDVDGCAEALAYLRGAVASSVPASVVEWGRQRDIDATRVARCPISFEGHEWQYNGVPQIPLLEESIRQARESLPRVEQQLLETLSEAEQLLAESSR